MRLFEYEGRELFLRYGIGVPRAQVADCVDAAVSAAETIGYPVVIKSQVLAGGRGKAGGVKVAANNAEAVEHSRQLFGLQIKGEITKKVLVSEKVSVAQELYAGVTYDSRNRVPVLMVSLSGGMDIEEVARTAPEKVLKMYLVPTQPKRTYKIVDLLRNSGLQASLLPAVSQAIRRLLDMFDECDATTAEINPLAITADGTVLAIDSKVVIDDSALLRQSVTPRREELSPLEARAKKIGVNYVQLNGNIAVIAGGAGLAMATMDLVAHFQAKAASFLDTGGGISSDRMAEALRISLATPGVEGVVINAFGGINNCEVMAKGVSQVVDEDKPAAKIVVKMRGHSQDAGWKLLEDRNIPVIKYGTSEEAVEQTIRMVGRRV